MDDKSHHGGCQCGAIRYRIEGDLPDAYACHCGACKKQSASAFSLSIPIEYERIQLSGVPAMFTVTGFSGAEKGCYFCPDCGTRLWHRSTLAPANVSLKVGTLDDVGKIAPAYHLWVSKKLDWVQIDPSVPAFETQPGDLQKRRFEK